MADSVLSIWCLDPDPKKEIEKKKGTKTRKEKEEVNGFNSKEGRKAEKSLCPGKKSGQIKKGKKYQI